MTITDKAECYMLNRKKNNSDGIKKENHLNLKQVKDFSE